MATTPDLQATAKTLAMLGLQSDRYRDEPDFRDAVDDVLAALAATKVATPDLHGLIAQVRKAHRKVGLITVLDLHVPVQLDRIDFVWQSVPKLCDELAAALAAGSRPVSALDYQAGGNDDGIRPESVTTPGCSTEARASCNCTPVIVAEKTP